MAAIQEGKVEFVLLFRIFSFCIFFTHKLRLNSKLLFEVYLSEDERNFLVSEYTGAKKADPYLEAEGKTTSSH